MGRQEPEMPQILSTTDYKQFKFMIGNRSVDNNHVTELVEAIKKSPHLLPSSPISVNENMFIIDGQHRLLAAEKAKRPIYYIITKGITISDTRILNVTQRRWTILDFARSYAESGVMEYRIFIEMHLAHPKLPLGALMYVLIGQDTHDMGKHFRQGDFYIGNIERAQRDLNNLDRIMNASKVALNKPMTKALIELMHNNKEFDVNRLVNKLSKENARERWELRNTMKDNFRSIEDVYSFHSPSVTRFY